MPAKTRKLIAWDSCVIIDSLQKKERYEFVRPMIKEAEDGDLMVVVSTMAMAETYRIDGCPPEDEVRIIEEFFDRKWVHPEEAGSAIAKIARDLCRDHGIVNPDAVHVATAKFTNCKVFLTRDGVRKRRNKEAPPLLPLDGKILLADGTPLRIMTPQQYMETAALVGKPLFPETGNVSSAIKEDISDATARQQQPQDQQTRPQTEDAQDQGRLGQGH